MYFVVALALYMQSSAREVLRCLLEGLRWMAGPDTPVHVAGDAGISLARSRLGSEPVERLHDELVGPVARRRHTRGVVPAVAHGEPGRQHAGRGRRGGQRGAFGRPGASRGRSAFPKVRFVSLVEGGTHVLFGTRMGRTPRASWHCRGRCWGSCGKACSAWRIGISSATSCGTWLVPLGRDLVWRLRKNRILPCERRLRDGLLPEHRACVATGAAAGSGGRAGAGGGIPPGGGGGGRAAVPSGDERAGPGAGSGPGTRCPVP